MSARLTIMLAAVTATLAIGIGCGGNDSNEGSAASGTNGGAQADADTESSQAAEDGEQAATGSAPDKKAFLKQASQACIQEGKNLFKEVAAYGRKYSAEGLSEEVLIAKMAKDVIAPAIEAQIAAVREIEPPEGDEEEIEALLDAQQEAVDEIKALDSADSLEAVQKHFEEAAVLYEAYGFNACKLG